MSVLNQSGEEQVECPLCMEPLEVDDLNFFPCTCGYQICRFCWHRIRTDENGLCPACRKGYPENPADFKPLSQEEVAKLKAEKRHKDQQRKQKITENRKHLANVRVVQRNLVFVVGLPMRLADAEVLKKHEYFGKFGKIHKVVINQCTSYAGTQGPSASAYVTYQRGDDALRAIQAVNNISVDGRSIKSSLGTTKYCSHFMKNQACPKPDCMYLHDQGDSEASFTKEDMQQGKHQEYEKKLHDALINASAGRERKPTPSPPAVGAPVVAPQVTGKEAWPSLQPGVTGVTNGNGGGTNAGGKTAESGRKTSGAKNPGGGGKKRHSSGDDNRGKTQEKHATYADDPLLDGNDDSTQSSEPSTSESASSDESARCDVKALLATRLFEPDNNSFFSSNSFTKLSAANNSASGVEWQTNGATMSDVLMPTVHPAEDWQAAFGFSAPHQPPPTPPTDPQLAPDTRDDSDDRGANPGHVFTSLHSQLAQNDAAFQANRLGNQRLTNGATPAASKFFSQYHPRGAPDTPPPPRGYTEAAPQSKYLDQPPQYADQSKYIDQSAYLEQHQSKYLEQPHSKYLEPQSNYLDHQSKYLDQQQSKYIDQQTQSKYIELQQQSKYLDQQQSKYLDQQQSKYLDQQPQSKYLEQQSKYLDHGFGDPGNYGYREGYTNSRPAYATEGLVNGGRLHNGELMDESDHGKSDSGFQRKKYGEECAEEVSNSNDDWGFDLFHETQKALAELMEKEPTPAARQQFPAAPDYQHPFHSHFTSQQQQQKLLDFGQMQHLQQAHRSSAPASGCSRLLDGLGLGTNQAARTRLPPPGFTSAAPNHMNSFGLGIPRPAHTASKILPFLSRNNGSAPSNNSNGSVSPGVQQQQQQQQQSLYGGYRQHNGSSEHFTAKDWSENLRSLLPSAFTEPPTHTTSASKGWTGPCTDWTALDPAIVSSSRPTGLHHPPPGPAPWLRHLDDRAAYFAGNTQQDWSAPPPGFTVRNTPAGTDKIETENTFLCF